MNCHKTSQGSDSKCHKPSGVGIIYHNLSQLDTIYHNLSQNVRKVAYAALLQINVVRNKLYKLKNEEVEIKTIKINKDLILHLIECYN
jgi:hypothetical protein